MGLETFLFQKIFHQLLTAAASRHDYFTATTYFVLFYFHLMFTETLLRETDKTAC